MNIYIKERIFNIFLCVFRLENFKSKKVFCKYSDVNGCYCHTIKIDKNFNVLNLHNLKILFMFLKYTPFSNIRYLSNVSEVIG